jgi:hypothetical protein
LLIIVTPHTHYRALVADKPVIHIWNVLGTGIRI